MTPVVLVKRVDVGGHRTFQDVGALVQRIRAVVLDARRLDREDLDRRLADVERRAAEVGGTHTR